MYNLETREVILEIPKNGSRSLVKAATLGYGKRALVGMGHHTLREFVEHRIDKVVPEGRLPVDTLPVVAVFRNPVNRLASQVRQAMTMKAGRTVDDCMKACWDQSDVLFKPQWEFVSTPLLGELDIQIRAWDIEDIDKAQKYVSGGKEFNFHKNRATHGTVDLNKIIEHRLFDDIVNTLYKKDFALWLDACKNRDDKGMRK